MSDVVIIEVKPLTVNRAWRGGRRFKSHEYVAYEKELAVLLPPAAKHRVEGKVELRYRFFVKNDKLSDADNMVKPLQDILTKHGFIDDDRFIYRFSVEKFHSATPRIEVEILPYT